MTKKTHSLLRRTLFASAACFQWLACTTPNAVSDAASDGAADAQQLADAGTGMDGAAIDRDAMNNPPEAAVSDGAADATADSPTVCMAPMTMCADACVSTETNTAHCGGCNRACPMVANGTAGCSRGMCTIECNMGFENVGGTCIATGSTNRQIFPISGADATLLRPTFRWELRAPFDGGELQLCRDRACMQPIESVAVTGNSATPTMPLTPGRPVFWRVRGRIGVTVASTYSPTWVVHIPWINARSEVDTSFRAHTDLNGDGLDELIIGSPNASRMGRNNTGEVAVFSGVSVAPIATYVGRDDSEYFGQAVAGAGDLNGDGLTDLVVGAPNAVVAGRSENGRVYVIYSAPDGMPAMPVRILEGANASDRFGYSVAGAGDVNGDGYGDLLVGVANSSPGGRMNAGAVHVYYGSAAGIAAVPSRVIEGVAAGDQFGSAVATAGDVNGDRFSDIIIGAPDADPAGRPDAGTAAIFHGSAMGLSASPAVVLADTSMQSVDYGTDVSIAGDINGDGYSDVVVGDYSANIGGARPGAGLAAPYLGGRTGVSPMTTRLIPGPNMNDNVGWAVAAGGDINGDGFGDLIVSSPTSTAGGLSTAGRVGVFFGSAMGVPMAEIIIDGIESRENTGWSVTGVDMNGDGYGDVAVGVRGASIGGRSRSGAARLYQGSMGGVGAPPVRAYSGPTANDQFGTSMAR